MKIIGITGGIGAGKSTVSAMLREKGCRVLDADAIAREMTEKGSPVLPELAAALGSEVLTEKGELDRKRTAEIVFSDPGKKALLEKLITSRVLDDLAEQVRVLRTKPEGVTFLDVPLLFETEAWRLCDEVWFVTADRETRIARVMAREGCSRKEVLARMAAQMPEEEKAERADVVICNSGDLGKLRQRLEKELGGIQ